MKQLYLTAAEYASLVNLGVLTPDGLTAIQFLEIECDIIAVSNTNLAIAHRRKLKANGKPLDIVSVTARALDHATKLAIAGTGNDVMKGIVGIIEDVIPVLLAPFVTVFPSAPKGVLSGSQMPIELVGLAGAGVGRGVSVTWSTDDETPIGAEVWYRTVANEGTVLALLTVPTVVEATYMTLGICQSVRVDYSSTPAGGGTYSGDSPTQYLMYDKIKVRVNPA